MERLKNIWNRFWDSFIGVYLAAFLLINAGWLLGIPIDNLLNKSDADLRVLQTITGYMLFSGIWVLTVLYMLVTKKNRPILKAITPKVKGNNLKNLGIGILTGFCMNLICANAALMNHDITITFACFEPLKLLVIFLAVFIQSSAEELICRVFIYQRLVRRYHSIWLAMILNAAYFGVLHLGNAGVTPISVATIIATGLAMSAQVVYMDSAWAAMGLHTAWNFTQNILLGLPNSGMLVPYSMFKADAVSDSWAYSIDFGLEGGITALVVNLAVFAGIVIWGVSGKRKPTDIWENVDIPECTSSSPDSES